MGESNIADGILIAIAFTVGASIISIPIAAGMAIWQLYVQPRLNAARARFRD